MTSSPDAPTVAPPEVAPDTPSAQQARRVWWRVRDEKGRLSEGPWARAALVAVRQGLGRGVGEVPAMWPLYTQLDADGRITNALRAEHLALSLYGAHQQSRPVPMHSPGTSVGTALRSLKLDGHFSSDAVDRRVAAAATATSLEEVAAHLRGLVSQLRSVKVGLDYDQLMRDLTEWQRPAATARVRRRWGLDYHAPRRADAAGEKRQSKTIPNPEQ